MHIKVIEFVYNSSIRRDSLKEKHFQVRFDCSGTADGGYYVN